MGVPHHRLARRDRTMITNADRLRFSDIRAKLTQKDVKVSDEDRRWYFGIAREMKAFNNRGFDTTIKHWPRSGAHANPVHQKLVRSSA